MAWRYTVAVPQFIQNKDSEGELVTLFRVNVLLQAPDASSEDLLAKPPFFVLRRFSQFRQLFEQLKAALPDTMRQRAMLPPSKHTLHFGTNQDLLGKRREELERWLWKLIATPEVARSSQLKSFLEFEKAMQRALQQRMAVGYAGSTTLSALTSPISSLHNWKGHRGSAASSEAGDFDDQRSEASYATATTATNTPRASTAGVSGLHSMEQTATQLQHNAAQEARRGLPPHHSSPGMAPGGSVAGAISNRLGLPLEQRSDVRRLMDLLQRRMDQGGRDLRGAVAEVTLLVETNRLLAGRLSEVQFQLEGGKSTREVELEREAAEVEQHLAAMSATISGLQSVAAGVDSQRAALHESQTSVSELSARLSELSATSSSRLQMLNQQVSMLQVQLDESHQEKKELLSRMQEWELTPSLNQPVTAHTIATNTSTHQEGASQDSAQAENGSSTTRSPNLTSRKHDSSMEVLSAALESSSRQREALEVELQSCKAGMLADREKARADQTVLAKEIKRLRGELLSVQSSVASEAAAAMVASSGAAAVREEALLAQLHLLEGRCTQLVREQSASADQAVAAAAANNQASSAAAAAAATTPADAQQQAALVMAISAATARAEAAEQRLSLVDTQLVTASQQVTVMQARCDALATEVSLTNNCMEDSLQVHLRKMLEQSAQLEQATSRATSSDALAAELAARITELDALLAAAQTTATSSNTIITNLAARNADLEALLTAAQTSATSSDTTVAGLAAQNASLQATVDASHSSLAASNSMTADLRQQVLGLEASISASDAMTAELRLQLTALDSSREESRTECLSLRETGKTLTQQVLQLQQAREALRREALETPAQHDNGPCKALPEAPPPAPTLTAVLVLDGHEKLAQNMAAELLLLQHRTAELESLLQRSHCESREMDSLREQLTATQAVLGSNKAADPFAPTVSAITAGSVSTLANSSGSGVSNSMGNGHLDLSEQGSLQTPGDYVLTAVQIGDSSDLIGHASQDDCGDGGHGTTVSVLAAGAEGSFLLRAAQQQQELQAANDELALRVAQLQQLGSANAELASQVAQLQESLQKRQQEDHHQYDLSSLPSSPTLRPRPSLTSSLQEAGKQSFESQNAAELAQVFDSLHQLDSVDAGEDSEQQQHVAMSPALSELPLLQSRIQELESQLDTLQQLHHSQPGGHSVEVSPEQEFIPGSGCTDSSHSFMQQQLDSATVMITDLQGQLAALETQLQVTANERFSLTQQLELLRSDQALEAQQAAQTLSNTTASLQAEADRRQRELQLEHDSLIAVAANQRVQLQQELAGARFELSTSRLARPPAPVTTSATSHFSSSYASPVGGNVGGGFSAEATMLGDDVGDLLSFEGMDVSPQILYVPPPPPGPPPLLELEPDYPHRPALQLVQRENDTLHRHLSELQRRFDELTKQTAGSSGVAIDGSGTLSPTAVLPPQPPPPPPPQQQPQPVIHPSLGEPPSGIAVSEVVLTLVQSVEAVILEARALLTQLHQSNTEALASAAVPPSPSALDAFLAAQSAVTTSMHSIIATAKSELSVLPLMPSLPEGLDSVSVQSMGAMEASLRTLLADALQLSCQACLRANELSCDKFLGQVFPSAGPPPPPPPPPSNNVSGVQQSGQQGLWPAHQQQQQQQRQPSSNEAQQGTSLWGVANNNPPSRKAPLASQAGYGPPPPTTYDPFASLNMGRSNSNDGSGLNVRNVFNRMMGSSPNPPAPASSPAPNNTQQFSAYPFQPASGNNTANSNYAPPGFTAPTPSPQPVMRGGTQMIGSSGGSPGNLPSASSQQQPLPNPNVLGGLGQRMSDAVNSLGLGLPGGTGPAQGENRRW